MQIEFEALRTLLVMGVLLVAGYKLFVSLREWVTSTQEHIRRVEEQIAKANNELVALNNKLSTYESLVKKLTIWETVLPPQVKEAMQTVKPMDLAKTGLGVMAGIVGVAAEVGRQAMSGNNPSPGSSAGRAISSDASGSDPKNNMNL